MLSRRGRAQHQTRSPRPASFPRSSPGLSTFLKTRDKELPLVAHELPNTVNLLGPVSHRPKQPTALRLSDAQAVYGGVGTPPGSNDQSLPVGRTFAALSLRSARLQHREARIPAPVVLP